MNLRNWQSLRPKRGLCREISPKREASGRGTEYPRLTIPQEAVPRWGESKDWHGGAEG